MKQLDYTITYAIKERNEILLASKATANIARRLLAHIDKTSVEDKTVVFSKRTKQSEAVCGKDNIYNGTIPKKTAKFHFDQFEDGDIKVLGTCDKINRGVNIPNLYNAIFETFYGSDTKAIQRFGRLMRLKPDEVATAYILLPYYVKENQNNIFEGLPTQQVTWAQSMLRSTNVKDSTVWDYRTIKSNN